MQPSVQPSAQPTYFPTSQPTLAACNSGSFIKGAIRKGRESFGVAQGSCELCPAGKISTLRDAQDCSDCAAGQFATTAGLSACQPAPAGSFTSTPGSSTASLCAPGLYAGGSESVSCLPCVRGTYGGGPGTVTCTPCPKNFYSGQTGTSACSACPFGRLTPVEGATSDTDCLTPAPNFAWGSAALFVAAGLGFVYVMRGRFHLASLNRRKEMVAQLKILFSEFRNKIEAEVENLGRISRKEQLKEFVGGIVSKNRCSHAFNVFWDICLTLIFAVLSVVFVALGTVFFFVASVSGIFFASLIYWKQNGALLGLVHYQHMIAVVTDNTLILFARLYLPPQLLAVARFALELIRDLFGFLALIKIDLSGLNVTCEGSKAPLMLLINLLVFGSVVIIIQSQVVMFRSLVLAPTIKTYTSFLLSSEYRNSYLGRPFTGIKRNSCSCFVWLWQSALPRLVRQCFHPAFQYVKYAYAVLQVIPVLIFSSLVDIKVLMRFAIAQVRC